MRIFTGLLFMVMGFLLLCLFYGVGNHPSGLL
jgi:hypothetical protein